MSARNLRGAIRAASLVGGSMAVLSSVPAYAHHAMGGGKMTTLGQGLLSGLAHPVIGLDHCLFILSVGALSAFLPGGALLIAAFLVASFFGVVLHLAQIGLPWIEPALAATILASGVLLMTERLRNTSIALALASVGGLIHGYALAESIVGVEATPLAAYLAGLTIVQSTMMILAGLVASVVLTPGAAGLRRTQWAGSAICLAGAVFLITRLAGA